jgi:hypothetical protein
MPKRSSKIDENEMAFDGLNELMRCLKAIDKGKPIDQPAKDDRVKNPQAVALGRMGALKRGKARAEKMPARNCKAIDKRAQKCVEKQLRMKLR